MSQHVLFVQGGGGKEDHAADSHLVNSLRKNLGSFYTVHYPLLENEPFPDFGRIEQIKREIASVEDRIILVGHSLGASMLLKYLSEHKTAQKMAGVFLLSTPYWSGEEDWVQSLKLKANFPEELPQNVPFFFYHCQDDNEVPFEHFAFYRQKVGQATFREIASGGHQLNHDASLVARDIKYL